MKTPLIIHIIEDNRLFGEELQYYLEGNPAISSVKLFGSMESWLKDVTEQADVMLVDIGLPGIDGISGITHILKKYPAANIVMLSLFDDADRIFQALRSGAVGYVHKDTSLEKIFEVIEVINEGGSYMSPQIARQLVKYFAVQKQVSEELTVREHQIVVGIVDGLSYKLIADRLEMKLSTLQWHIKNIYRKLNVNSRTEVIHKMGPFR